MCVCVWVCVWGGGGMCECGCVHYFTMGMFSDDFEDVIIRHLHREGVIGNLVPYTEFSLPSILSNLVSNGKAMSVERNKIMYINGVN